MPRITRYVHDPYTGERLPLIELAARYDLGVQTLQGRLGRGKTGPELVAPVNAKKSRASRLSRQKRKPTTEHQRREQARQLLMDPRNHWLAQPLVRQA